MVGGTFGPLVRHRLEGGRERLALNRVALLGESPVDGVLGAPQGVAQHERFDGQQALREECADREAVTRQRYAMHADEVARQKKGGATKGRKIKRRTDSGRDEARPREHAVLGVRSGEATQLARDANSHATILGQLWRMVSSHPTRLFLCSIPPF